MGSKNKKKTTEKHKTTIQYIKQIYTHHTIIPIRNTPRVKPEMKIYIWETRVSVNEAQAEFFETKPNLFDNSHYF